MVTVCLTLFSAHHRKYHLAVCLCTTLSISHPQTHSLTHSLTQSPSRADIQSEGQWRPDMVYLAVGTSQWLRCAAEMTLHCVASSCFPAQQTILLKHVYLPPSLNPSPCMHSCSWCTITVNHTVCTSVRNLPAALTNNSLFLSLGSTILHPHSHHYPSPPLPLSSSSSPVSN